ncbi:MAG: M15 family metallopeptidase [Clostridiales bacterium]|nr:M15 family metallopeptidase [Clostridiales bacterium]
MTAFKRFTSLACAGALALAMALPAQAAGTYSDLPETHWAYSDMDNAVQLGILNGVGGNAMAPFAGLNWAQYLAMVTRTFASSLYNDAVRSGLRWDAAGYQAAVGAGFILEHDFLPVTADTLDRPIVRQDVAVLLDRALPDDVVPYRYTSEPASAEDTLTDFSSLGPTYQSSVSRLFDLGIIKGKGDGTFGGGDPLQRCDGTVLLMRALNDLDIARYGEEKLVTVRAVDEAGNELLPARTVEAYIGQWSGSLLNDTELPHYVQLWDSRSVSSACSSYTVSFRPMTESEIQEEDFWDRVERGEANAEDYYLQDFWLKYPGENERKYLLLFGDTSTRRFSSQQQAESHMVTVTVPIWKLDAKGNKVSSTGSFRIHEALADDVKAIFTEIYNDPERFPIHDVGGYSWRGDSATGEHNCGTAIDINANENYQIRYGQVLAGSLWAPGSNPYSIGPDSSVVRIFEAHGWSWGGDAWAYDSDPSDGYHDYMHFSYMGG